MLEDNTIHKEPESQPSLGAIRQNWILKAAAGLFISTNGTGMTSAEIINFFKKDGTGTSADLNNSQFFKIVAEARRSQHFMSYTGELKILNSLPSVKLRFSPTPEIIDQFYPQQSESLYWYPKGKELALPLSLKTIFEKISSVLLAESFNEGSKAVFSKKCGVGANLLDQFFPIFSDLGLLKITLGNKSNAKNIQLLKLTELGTEVAKECTTKAAKLNSLVPGDLTSKEEVVLLVTSQEGDRARNYLKERGVDSDSVATLFSRLIKKGYLNKEQTSQGNILTVSEKGREYLINRKQAIELNKDFILSKIKINERSAALNTAPSSFLEKLVLDPKKAYNIKSLCAAFNLSSYSDSLAIGTYLQDKRKVKIIKNKTGEYFLVLPEYYEALKKHRAR